jgi:hypothetical protein
MAHAQRSSGDVALAETLFREGKDLMEQKRYAEACPKLAESQRLDPATGTLLALAVCHEAEGKTATAWAEFVAAEGLAENDKRDDRVAFARDHIQTLETMLSRLTIVVPNPARGLEVRRNGVLIGSAAWGTDTPVDPGRHEIEARAPGKRTWQRTVLIGASSDRQTVTVPVLAALTAPQPTTPTVEEPSPPPSPLVITGAVVGGLGIASIAVGAYFGVQAINKSDQAKSLCSPELCTDPNAVAINDEAEVAANVANVTLILGGVAVAAGITMIAVGATRSSSAAIELRPNGLVVRGAF